ncbi:MAG: NifU family protein [Planctomycetota bacterium]
MKPDQQETQQQIEQALSLVRPAMQADGGNVEFVSEDNGVVTVRLCGTCIACPSKQLTMNFGIERTLKDQLPWVTKVVRVE